MKAYCKNYIYFTTCHHTHNHNWPHVYYLMRQLHDHMQSNFLTIRLPCRISGFQILLLLSSSFFIYKEHMEHWSKIKSNLYTLSSLTTKLNHLNHTKGHQKSIWSNVIWYVKLYILWKCIQYTIHWDKTQMLKKFLQKK